MNNPSSKFTFSPTLFNIGWRSLIRRPWQSILMLLGITLGVAVVIAIDLANESSRRAFDLSTDAVAGRATHQVIAGPNGLDESVYSDLRLALPGIPMAPVIAEYVSSPNLGDLPLQFLGVDPFAETPFRNYLPSTEGNSVADGLTPFLTRPGAILISSGLAERFDIEPCTSLQDEGDCKIELSIGGYNRTAYVVGVLAPLDDLSSRALDGLVLADISTAQELMDATGTLSTIDIILPECSSDLSVVQENTATCGTQRLSELLPAGLSLQPVEARSGTIEEMTAAFRLNLTALSLLALVVGLFLIYNTMTFAVVRRRPLFGTLRCLGVSRREIFLLVTSEALIIGILGSLFGVLIGLFLGQEAVRLVTQTVNDLFFVQTVRGVSITGISLFKGVAVGTLATILTAAFPAWEAASVPPRAALSRSGLETKAQKAVGLAALGGILLLIFGGSLLILPGDNLVFSFTGTFAVIIGFAALTPVTTSLAMRVISPVTGKLGGLLGRMAPRNVVNSVSRTSIAVAALMVAVSVTIGISVMVSSFRYTVETWLGQTLQGDIYISPPGAGSIRPSLQVDPEVVDIVSAWEGVSRVDILRVVDLETVTYGTIQIGATNNSGIGDERLFVESIGSAEVVADALSDGALIISEPLARRLEISMADGFIELNTPIGPVDFPIAGIYYDYGSTLGLALMDLDYYRSRWADPVVSAIALRLEPELSPDTVTEELQQAIIPIQTLDIRPNQALRESALVVFDRTFAITSSLQGLATLVAFIGVLSALLALQLEKSRELGILRAIGLTAGQLRRLVFLETGLMGAVAGLLSIPTGFILSLILIFIINRRAFGWTLQFQLSAAPFLEAILIAIIAALLAGVYPAFKMSRIETAEALRGE